MSRPPRPLSDEERANAGKRLIRTLDKMHRIRAKNMWATISERRLREVLGAIDMDNPGSGAQLQLRRLPVSSSGKTLAKDLAERTGFSEQQVVDIALEVLDGMDQRLRQGQRVIAKQGRREQLIYERAVDADEGEAVHRARSNGATFRQALKAKTQIVSSLMSNPEVHGVGVTKVGNGWGITVRLMPIKWRSSRSTQLRQRRLQRQVPGRIGVVPVVTECVRLPQAQQLGA